MKLKKILSLLIVVTLLFSLAVPAFAIEDLPRYIMIDDGKGNIIAFDVDDLMAADAGSPIWKAYYDLINGGGSIYIGYEGGANDGVIIPVALGSGTIKSQLESATKEDDDVSATVGDDVYFVAEVTEDGDIVVEKDGETGIIDETGTFVPEDPGTDPGDEELEALLEEADEIIATLKKITAVADQNRDAAHAAVADAEAIILELADFDGTTDKVAEVRAEIVRVEALPNYEAPVPVTLVSASVNNFGQFVLEFSGELDETSAETVANYSFGAFGAATAAVLQEDGCTVILTKAVTKGATVTITISNLRDVGENLISTTPIITEQLEALKSNVTGLSVAKYDFAANTTAAAALAPSTDIKSTLTGDAKIVVLNPTPMQGAIQISVAAVNETDSNAATANATIEWRVGTTGEWNVYAPKSGIVTGFADNAITNIYIKVTAQNGVDEAIYTVRIVKGTISGNVILLDGSAGLPGNQKVVGLESGKKYVIDTYTGGSKDTNGVDADGALVAVPAAAELTGTEITGLTNGATYFVRELSSAKQITSFILMVDGVAKPGVITEPSGGAAGTIIVDVPAGKSYTSVTPTIVCSLGATVHPAATATANLEAGETYTVTAEDGSTATYTAKIQKTDIIEITEAAIDLAAAATGATAGSATVRTTAPYNNPDQTTKFGSTSTKWYVTKSVTPHSGVFVTATQYEATVTLTATSDYKFTDNTVIKVFEDASTMTATTVEFVDAEKTISTDYLGNSVITFTVRFPITTTEAFAPVDFGTSLYTVNNALGTAYNIRSNGNYTFTVDTDGSGTAGDKVYSAGMTDPQINQDVYALLQGLSNTDTIGFTNKKVSAVTKTLASNGTVTLNSGSTADTVVITGKDDYTLTVIGTAKNVTLTGGSTAATKFDVSGLVASGTISTDASNPSTVVLGASQRLTAAVAGVVVEPKLGNTTTGIVTLGADTVSVIINKIEFAHGGTGATELKIDNGKINVLSSNAATKLEIDAANLDNDNYSVYLTGVNTAVEVTGGDTNVLTVAGTTASGKNVTLVAGAFGVDVTGLTPGVTGKVIVDATGAVKVDATGKEITVDSSDAFDVTIAGAGTVNVTDTNSAANLIVEGNITTMTVTDSTFAGYTHNSGTIGTLTVAASDSAVALGSQTAAGTGLIGTLNITGAGSDPEMTVSVNVTTLNVEYGLTSLVIDRTAGDLTVGTLNVKGGITLAALAVGNKTSGTATITTLNAKNLGDIAAGSGVITTLTIGKATGGTGVVAGGNIAVGSGNVSVLARGELGTSGSPQNTIVTFSENNSTLTVTTAATAKLYIRVQGATNVTESGTDATVTTITAGSVYDVTGIATSNAMVLKYTLATNTVAIATT